MDEQKDPAGQNGQEKGRPALFNAIAAALALVLLIVAIAVVAQLVRVA